MSKLRVHDMAGEFGISPDEVMNLLRAMDVSVRSHLSPLTDEQVARVRARWEREKRVRATQPAAPARRRRGAAAAPAASAGATAVRRRTGIHDHGDPRRQRGERIGDGRADGRRPPPPRG